MMVSVKTEIYKNFSQKDINNAFVQACRENDLFTVEFNSKVNLPIYTRSYLFN